MKRDESSMCLFIGIPVSLRTLRAVAGAASQIKERTASDNNIDLRWVAPARYHVTVHYLGWVKSEAMPAIRDQVAVALASQKSFEMRCRDLGAFPSVDKAQILWAGIDDGQGELGSLAGKIARAMSGLGFPADPRPYHPHVTMARLKAPANLAKLIQEVPAHVFSKTSVESLILYKTSVESEASEYEKIASWDLR